MITKIFIGGLLPESDEMAIAQMVGPYGDIVTIKVVRDKVSRKSKGFAFVEMANREMAEDVISALNGTALKDKVLEVNIVKDALAPPKAVYHKLERSGDPVKKKRPRLSR
jgi:RNA recognition motif-containing protein